MATRPALVPLIPGEITKPAAEAPPEPAAPAPKAAPPQPTQAALAPRKQAILTPDGWLCPES